MGEELLAEYASSVLAKIKPSNLFTVSNSYYDVDGLVGAWNNEFNSLDIYFKVVSKREKNSSVLVYRRDFLIECINNCDTSCYLKTIGYEVSRLDKCIDCMANKLVLGEFPHEIGLFLGYPYEDVMGFIANKGQNYICSGYWKVYEDEEAKIKTFELYNSTRLKFLNAIENGTDIRELIAV